MTELESKNAEAKKVIDGINSKGTEGAAAPVETPKEKTPKEKTPKAKVEKAPKAEKTPGVIATIFNTISNATTPVSQSEIIEILKTAFPGRDVDAMTTTVKIQIGGKKRPSRMEREKKVEFELTQDGEITRYMLKK